MQRNKGLKETEPILEQRLLKLLVRLLIVILLLNPVIVFLDTGSLIASILCPTFVLALMFVLNKKRSLSRLNVLLFNIVVIVSFFLHAEAILNCRYSEYIIEDIYRISRKYYFNKPYLDKTFRDKEFIVQYKTNKQGFRISAEDDPETTVNKADWLFIGDSYTQGAQVQYEDLFTSKLYDSFSNKIIVNAGISGFGIADEYYYFINEGRKLRPEKVFLQICNFNDFMNVKEKSSGFSDYLMHYSNFARLVLYNFKYANPAELPLGRWTEPFYPDVKSNRDYNIFYTEQSEQKIRDLKNFEHYLSKLNKAVKDIGAELIVFQIPTKEQIYYKYFEEVVTAFKLDIEKLDMKYPNTFLKNLCDGNEITYIDLLDDFLTAEGELFYQFDEHLNVPGHVQVANSISKYLLVEEDCQRPTLLSRLNVGDRYPNIAINSHGTLTYQSFRDGNFELFLSDTLLLNIERLTWNNIDEAHPYISPDGNLIAFTEGDQAGLKTKVALMQANGNGRKYITTQENTFGAIPAFNHTGTKIAYAEWQFDADGKLSNPRIVIFDLLQGEKHVITSDSFEHWRPVFSPDGKKLYFIAKENNNQFDIYEYSLDEGVRRNITNTPYDEWDPAISPDGKTLVYAAQKNNNWDLFLHDLQLNQCKQLTDSQGDEWDPAFSPDGISLYYAGTFGLRNGIFKLTLN